MRLFDFVAEEDKRLNLADSSNASAWVRKLRFWPQNSNTSTDGEWHAYWTGWHDEDRKEFKQNINAVRRLYKRFRGMKTRNSTISDIQSDIVLRKHIEAMQVKLRVRPGGKGGPHLLTPERLVGYEITPGGIKGTDRAISSILNEFWQLVFWSLVSDQAVNVCESCGRKLPSLTPTGRRSKKRFCPTCTDKKYKEKLPPDSRKNMWRAQKKNQRKSS